MNFIFGMMVGINIGAMFGWYMCKRYKGDLFALISDLMN